MLALFVEKLTFNQIMWSHRTTILYLCIILLKFDKFMIESQLTDRCKQADSEAQRIVYERYAGKMLGVCLRYAGNRSEAEDLMHDGFVTAFEKIKQFKNKGSFEGWLQRIMVNTALMHLRNKTKETGRVPFEEVEWQITDDKQDEALSETAIQIVQQAEFTKEEILEQVKNLPEGFRVVFNLYALEQMKHREIAKTLGISVGTSKSQLFYARKQIQKALYHKAVEQKKNKENKKRAIVAIFSGMGLGLNHIDVLAQEALSELSVPTSGGWEALQQSLSSGSTATQSAAVATGASVSTKVIVTIAAAAAITSGALLLEKHFNAQDQNTQEINASAPENTPVNKNTFVLPADSIPENPNADSRIDEPENSVTPTSDDRNTDNTVIADTVRVPVKRVIRVKKQTIVRDTIHTKDTVFIR